jgi:hypothetical protein
MVEVLEARLVQRHSCLGLKSSYTDIHYEHVICAFVSECTVVFPKEGHVTRNATFLRYPSRSKNKLFLLSAVQNIANLFDLEPCPANLIFFLAFLWEYYGMCRITEERSDS